MSYTQQKVVWESRNPQNAYGDISYNVPIYIKARKQSSEQMIKTSEGKELLSKHVFYVEPLEGCQIKEMDKLDGELILTTYEMRTLSGAVKMFRFTT